MDDADYMVYSASFEPRDLPGIQAQRFWEIVLIALNDSPAQASRAFLLGRPLLKWRALLARTKYSGVIETIQ
jgi:hypothetical protein